MKCGPNLDRQRDPSSNDVPRGNYKAVKGRAPVMVEV